MSDLTLEQRMAVVVVRARLAGFDDVPEAMTPGEFLPGPNYPNFKTYVQAWEGWADKYTLRDSAP